MAYYGHFERENHAEPMDDSQCCVGKLKHHWTQRNPGRPRSRQRWPYIHNPYMVCLKIMYPSESIACLKKNSWIWRVYLWISHFQTHPYFIICYDLQWFTMGYDSQWFTWGSYFAWVIDSYEPLKWLSHWGWWMLWVYTSTWNTINNSSFKG